MANNILDPSQIEMQPMFPQQQARPVDVQNDQQKAPASTVGMSFNQMLDQEIASMVTSRLELSKNWRRTRRLIWDKCWQHMKGTYDKAGKANWQSTTFMHMTSKVVEVIVANLHGAMLGPDVPIEYQTRRPDMDQLVRSHNELIQVDLDKCDYKAHLTDFLRNIAVCGTGIGEVGYIKQEETVMIKQRQLPQQTQDMMASLGFNDSQPFIPKKLLVKDYATIVNKDIYNIYPQPRIAEFSKDTWVIEKGKITNKELMQGSRDVDPYYKFDNVTPDLLAGSGLQRVDQDPELQTRRYTMLDYFTANHFLDPDREHELLTFYGQIPVWYLQTELRKDPNRLYDSVPGWIQVVDGQYVIRKRISPWRDGEPPYFKGNYIRIPGEFYGIGVAELVLGLQIEKNEIRNSRMDNINLSMNKIIAVVKDHIPKGQWERLQSSPGAKWVVQGVDDVRKAIQAVEFGDITKDSWMASQEIDREGQETTGAVKATIGVGPQMGEDAGGNTFRGQMLNQQAATERFMLYARVIESMGLKKAIQKFYHRIYQFKSYQQAMETLGGTRAKSFQFIPPEDLERIAKLVPLGVMTMENKGIKLAQMNQFTQTWMMMPFLKKLEMARRQWVEMGFPEPDTVLFSDEEMQQFNMQAMQLTGGMGPGMPGSPPTPGSPGLLGPNGQPLPPQTGQRGNVPGGQPVAGNVPPPRMGMPRPALQPRGPGASPADVSGRPLG